jgi:hypothetical protein
MKHDVVVTVGDLIELAKIGARHIRNQSSTSSVLWLGCLPTEAELNQTQEELKKLLVGWVTHPIESFVLLRAIRDE